MARTIRHACTSTATAAVSGWVGASRGGPVAPALVSRCPRHTSSGPREAGLGSHRKERSSLVPISDFDARLAQDLFHKRPINVAALMRIWNADLEFALLHELMPGARDRSCKTKAAEAPDQFLPRNRLGHHSCGLERQTDSTEPWNRIVIADVDDQPLFKNLLEDFAAGPDCSLIGPHAG